MPKRTQAPDVQAAQAPREIHLTRVGVRRVKKPVIVHRPGHAPAGVVATFDLFVDLPKTQKGTHMSRNLEALADILDAEVATPSPGLENLCRRLALRLLDKHSYATHAQVEADADYFLPRTGPGGKPSIEAYRLRAQAHATRQPGSVAQASSSPKRPRAGALAPSGRALASPSTARRIGVEVVGMTACPCAMETARHKMVEAGHKPDAALPFITHNQRNRVTLFVDLPEGADVEAADLVEVCEGALSAPTFEILKRGDEADLVIRAHQNPRFVEDVVREALHAAAVRFARLGPDTTVFASSEAEESIHKHNAYAERVATFREVA